MTKIVAATNGCFRRINNWLEEHTFLMAPHKTEVLILKGRTKRQKNKIHDSNI